MAKMRWAKVEWQRKSSTHEPLTDPYLSVPTERERQKQSQKKRKKKAVKKTVVRTKRGSRSAARVEAAGSFHSATLKAVERVSRHRGTQDAELIARDLGISEATVARYLAEVARRQARKGEARSRGR